MTKKNKQILDTVARQWMIIAIFLVVVAFAIFCIRTIRQNNRTVDEKLFEMSAQNLEDTYKEVTSFFTSTTQAHWNYLDLIDFTLDVYMNAYENKYPEKIQKFVSEFNEQADVMVFYFIAEDGSYLTLDGVRGQGEFGTDITEVIQDGKPAVTVGRTEQTDSILFYVKPTGEKEFDGFTYNAIAFGYVKEALSDILVVSAYNGTSSVYLADTDGQIISKLNGRDFGWKNFLDAMSEYEISRTTTDRMEREYRDGLSGTFEVKIDGITYYAYYCPIDLQGWMMVSVTPVDNVNMGARDIQSSSMRMLIVMFAVVIVSIAGVMLYALMRMIRSKNSQLERQEQLFSVLAEESDIVYMMGSRKTLRGYYVSPNLLRYLGIPAAAERKDYTLIKNCMADEAEWERVCETLRTTYGKMVLQEIELTNVITKEQKRYRMTVICPVGHHADVLIVTLQDLSEEVKQRQILIDAFNTAKAASTSKTMLLSNMSHDIRTPMNAILGITTLMQNEELPPKARRYTAEIMSAGRQLLELINEMLDMSKIESGKFSLNLETFDLMELKESVQTLFALQAQDKKQTFVVTAKEIRHKRLMGDRVRLQQILNNLVSNAVKYTQEGGTIEVEFSELESRVKNYAKICFLVTDNGMGMSKEFQERIFESFSREETPEIYKIQGTGLGMAITKNLVELMGGTIHVESEQGNGSRFEVILELKIPEQDEEQTAAEENREAEEESSLRGMHFLCAEDNALNAEILEELLKMEEADCVICENGQALLEEFEKSAEGQYDMILMDVQMPIMNGYEAARAVRASAHPLAKTIPIIAMTANAFAEDIQEALNAGMDAHIAKPVDMKVLKKTIQNMRKQ